MASIDISMVAGHLSCQTKPSNSAATLYWATWIFSEKKRNHEKYFMLRWRDNIHDEKTEITGNDHRIFFNVAVHRLQSANLQICLCVSPLALRWVAPADLLLWAVKDCVSTPPKARMVVIHWARVLQETGACGLTCDKNNGEDAPGSVLRISTCNKTR